MKSRFRDEIIKLRAEGLSYREIQKKLKCSSSTVMYNLSPRHAVKTRAINGLTVTIGRRLRREAGIAALGGSCVVCGYGNYPGALDFHHINPNEKEYTFGISAGQISLKDYEQELSKCVIVCCRCHREIHGDAAKLPAQYPRFDKKVWDKFLTERRQIKAGCTDLENQITS